VDQPPVRREAGEGRGGVIIAVAAILGLVVFGVVLLIFPALLAWLISIGLVAMVLLAIGFVLVSIVIAFLTVGVGAYHLFRRHEVQGPEHGYTLDMVEEPPKKNV
jgi:hypothetical protein